METQESGTGEEIIINYYKFEHLLLLRKIIHDGSIDDNVEIPTQFRRDAVTDKKGFFIMFAVLLLTGFLVYTHWSLQTHQSDLPGKVFGITRNISNYRNQDLWYNLGTSWWIFLLNMVITIIFSLVVFYSVLCYPFAVLRNEVGCALMLLIFLMLLSVSFIGITASRAAFICSIIVHVPAHFIIAFAGCHYLSLMQSVVDLYKESRKIIFAMPGLLLLTFMSMFLQLIIVSFFITAATLSIAAESSFLLLLNIVVTNWALYFVEGFFCMVTAGSANALYNGGLEDVFPVNVYGPLNFRYDQPLKSAIVKSFVRVVKYHIGTIAFGSVLHPFITLMQKTAKVLFCNFFGALPNYKSSNPEPHLTALSKKYAYVASVMHGKPYIQAGKDAFFLFLERTPTFITTKITADVASCAIKLNIVLYPTTISCILFWVNDDTVWLATLQCLFANIIIVAAFFETIETTAHTLLANLCEDELIRKYFRIEFYNFTTN